MKANVISKSKNKEGILKFKREIINYSGCNVATAGTIFSMMVLYCMDILHIETPLKTSELLHILKESNLDYMEKCFDKLADMSKREMEIDKDYSTKINSANIDFDLLYSRLHNKAFNAINEFKKKYKEEK